jgi:flagellar protein FlgJ
LGDIGAVGLNSDGIKLIVEESLQQAQAGSQKHDGDFKRVFSHAMSAACGTSQVNPELDAPGATANEETRLRWTAQQLEIMFMQELFKGMRRTVPAGGLFEQSFSLQTYQEMLDAELAKNMAVGGGIGLSELIFKQLRG